MGVIYSETDRVNALAVLEVNGGNVSKTSREVGIPRTTLITWKNEMDAVRAGVEAAATLSDSEANAPLERWMAVQSLATAVLTRNLKHYDESGEILEPTDLKHVATVAGIAADKHLDYRDGRKGSQVNVSANAQAGVVIQRNTRSLRGD